MGLCSEEHISVYFKQVPETILSYFSVVFLTVALRSMLCLGISVSEVSEQGHCG